MTYAALLRIFKGSANPSRCRRCRQRLYWAIDDRGKYRPLDPQARPIREERDEKGRRYLVYEAAAFHRCPARQSTRPRATPTSQGSLL